jgi:WhiB family redox-sensing transcriptional regulator
VEWSDRAACLTAEPEQFFPIGTGSGADRETAAAKAVCRTCSVLEQCRDYALRTRQTFGVWGGLDEEERRALLQAEPVALAR